MAYVMWCAVQHEALLREEELLRHYHNALRDALPPEVEYEWSEWIADYELEFLDYFKTGLPQLMLGVTREDCAKVKDLYGWLTHEYDPQVMRLWVGKALDLTSRF